MKQKLTDALVAKAVLPPGAVDIVLWDSDVSGFGLRIRPAGKTWILAYRPAVAGRRACTKKMKLAALGAVAKVSAARTLAQVELGRIAAGADPLAARSRGRIREKARLGDLLARGDQRHAGVDPGGALWRRPHLARTRGPAVALKQGRCDHYRPDPR